MNFSPKEQTFICRGLDKASTETEINICATQLFRSLRERNVNGYDFIGQQSNFLQHQTEPPKDADGYQFYRDGFGWGRGRGRWAKWADGSTYWEDEHGYRHGPPNPGRCCTVENGTAPPPQPDGKWSSVRKQRATQAPQAITRSTKMAIFIVALTFFFICSVLAYLILPNRVFMILVGGFAAQWMWRALWKPQPGKIASAIGITILTLICFLLFYTLTILLIHNTGLAVVAAGFAACWFWRGLLRVNFLGN